MESQFENIAWQPLRAVVEDNERTRDLRSAGTSNNDVIDGMFRIGAITVYDALELTRRRKQVLDPEVAMQTPTYDFSYLNIPVNVLRVPGVQFGSLTVQIGFQAEGEAADALAGIWSLDPVRVETTVRVQVRESLSAKLKVSAAEIGAAESANIEYVVRRPTIEAFGLGLAIGGWNIMSEPGQEAPYGIHPMGMVVRMSKGRAWTGQIVLKASLRKAGIFRTRICTQRDGKPLPAFRIPAPER